MNLHDTIKTMKSDPVDMSKVGSFDDLNKTITHKSNKNNLDLRLMAAKTTLAEKNISNGKTYNSTEVKQLISQLREDFNKSAREYDDLLTNIINMLK